MSQDTLYHPRSFRSPKPQKAPIPYKDIRKKVIVLAGPTASGKTDLSIKLAESLDGEVVNCDSMQVYRDTDIGSAKATKEQREKVVHHMLDVRDVQDNFNVVQFYKEAREALFDILARGKVPLIVGGSGFYMHTLLFGPPQGPSSDPDLRKKLEDDYEKFGGELLYQKLKEFDPDYAVSITVSDRHKVIRALEIIMITGKKVSEIPKPSQEDMDRKLNLRCWFIYYPREQLYDRIDRRCDQMIEQGLVQEVMKLRSYGLEDNLTVANSIGYRQCLEFLNSPQAHEDWEHFITTFKRASRQYAKRQFTWFRKEKLFRWVDLSQGPIEDAYETIMQDFENAEY